MNKYGVTERGFRRKLYNEALEERKARAIEVFGTNIDISNTSFLGQLIENASWDEAELWEKLEDVYLSAYVDSSIGTSLDGVSKYIGASRRPATKSTTDSVVFKGTNGVVIPKGYRVSTSDESNTQMIVFETIKPITINKETATVGVQSIEAGKHTNVNKGAINQIVNPMSGIDSVINLDETFGGMDIENDEELRDRYNRSHSKGGGSTVPAIEAALLDINEVVDAFVIENDSLSIVSGRPPKSISSYVYGGKDNDIANAIFRNKSGGIQAYGNTTITIKDNKSREHLIGFTRVKAKDIYVRLSIDKADDYKGDSVTKRAVLNYIGGIDEDNITYKGLKLGESVILSRIISTIGCLGGINDIDVELSTNGKDYIKKNINITSGEIARTTHDKVVINHV